jgi:hypothetical protein
MRMKKQSPATPRQSNTTNEGTTRIALGLGNPIVHMESQHPIDILEGRGDVSYIQ